MKNNVLENLLPYGGEVYYYPHLFSSHDSDDFLKALLKDVDWKQEPIKIFGKLVMQPRLTAWFADGGQSYSYSGITMNALPWTKDLLKIKSRVEEIASVKFNSALLNLYRNGNDSVGWHRDNEKELGDEPIIASVSLGATRAFQLRDHKTKTNLISLELKHGSLVLMKGQTQTMWEHRIPKTAKQVEQRVNITFRVIKN
jgi:alkylated DNA repair dioxygenase AlkB